MDRPGARRAWSWLRRTPDRLVLAGLALLAYVPILLTRPGRVSADTKTYLLIDPADVLGSAASMWDPSVGAGTVPHQNIGYLFPLGPYYGAAELIGLPDWVAQRLLWGTLVFAAAAGTYRLARWIGWTATSAAVAATAYGFSPYLLSYLARLSVILAPWAAMPWMILLAARAARTRSWRPAAQFAVVVALVGSVNATALVFAGLGPVLWLLADVAARRVRVVDALAAAARIGIAAVAISAWWIAGLVVQGRYGLPILRYTETYQAVASASTPTELLRGLGYWFFYGGDRLGAWVGPAAAYVDDPAVMFLGFALAGLALLGLLVPFPRRGTAVLLLAVGLTVSAGAAPLGGSPWSGGWYGTWFETVATETTVGQALRSTPRALPLVVLAMALGLGAGTGRVAGLVPRRWPRVDRARARRLVGATAVGLVLVQLHPWFTGGVLTPSLLRDEELPAHVTELAEYLDASGDGRVWEVPAADFANYRWGGTVDPVLPGLIDRPYLARELVPQGGDGTADLLDAVERRIAEGWSEPEALAAVAAVFDVDTLAVRNDLEHERFRLARPGPLWSDLRDALGAPDHAGPTTTDDTAIPLLDEATLAHRDAADRFPVVAAFELGETPPVSAVTATAPIILAGNGDGVVDLAGAGMLPADRPILYAATLDQATGLGGEGLDPTGSDPWWVVTDTNRRRGRRWSTVANNLGALETAHGPVAEDDDPGDNRLDVFGDRATDQTVAVHRGDVADVRASSYGNEIAYTAEDAPFHAVDGDPSTAWRAGVFAPTRGLRLSIDLREPIDPGVVTLLQPVTGAVNRRITDVRITLDGERSVDAALDETSLTVPGQPVALPPGPFRSLELEVLGDSVGALASYAGLPGVGFAEVGLGDARDERYARLPDLTDTSIFDEDAARDDRLTWILTRQRLDPATTNRSAPESIIARELEVPARRTVRLGGEARLAADAPDAVLSEALGEPVRVVADRRLPGSPAARGLSAVDGDLATAWETPFDDVVGATLRLAPAGGGTTDAVTVSWLDDGRHSIPRALEIRGGDGQVRSLALPETRPVDGVATATVSVEPLPADGLRVTVTAVDELTTPEYFSGAPRVLPVGIAELAFDGVALPGAPAGRGLDTGCRDDLVELDGRPLAVRVTGDRATALGRGELTVEACDDSLVLDAGTHRLVTTRGATTGFDLDRLVLDTGEAAGARPAATTVPVQLTGQDDTSFTATLAPSADPLWLQLNQSRNDGWTATVDGRDLGPPVLVDGYANGWLLPPSTAERSVELRWTPQSGVRWALIVSVAAAVVMLGILLATRRHRPPAHRTTPVGRPWNHARWWPACVVGALLLAAGWAPAAVGAGVLALRGRRPALPAAVVVAAGAIAAGPVVVLQWRYDYPSGPDWPSRFGWTSTFAWMAVAAVVATAAASGAVRPRPQRRAPAPAE